MEPGPQRTFDEICDALAMMGLSRMIASPMVTHACKVAGLAPESLGPEHIAALAPTLERSLRMYLGADQIGRSLESIRALGLAKTARPVTLNTLSAVAGRGRPQT